MKFGYVRVSTVDQNELLQIDALIDAGVQQSNIAIDKVSGTSKHRDGLDTLMQFLRPGDVLVVWKLDRLARSIQHFVKLIEQLDEKGAFFECTTQPFLNTTDQSPGATLIRNIFASFAQFERDLISERTKAGLESAKRRGVVLGPPRGLSKKAKQKAILVEKYWEEGILTVQEICEELNISRGSYYKYLRDRGHEGGIRKYKGRSESKNE